MSFELTWQPKGVVKRFFGNVTSDELLGSVIQTEGDYRFDDLRYVINDFTECTGYSISTEIVDSIAAIDSGAALTNPHIKIAVVATNAEMIALAQQYADSPSNSKQPAKSG